MFVCLISWSQWNNCSYFLTYQKKYREWSHHHMNLKLVAFLKYSLTDRRKINLYQKYYICMTKYFPNNYFAALLFNDFWWKREFLLCISAYSEWRHEYFYIMGEKINLFHFSPVYDKSICLLFSPVKYVSCGVENNLLLCFWKVEK